MIRSYNEIAAMAVKAARGAGVPLGHAEEFGPAVAALASHKPADLGCLAKVLSAPIRPVAMNGDHGALEITSAQAIMAAPVAFDLLKAGSKCVRLGDVDAPALLSAYCRNSGVEVTDQEGSYEVSLSVAPDTKPAIQAIDFPDDVWETLNSFAARTYVPATAASRLAGAGAGLTDND